MSTPYDALLLLSFGGPEGPDDVLPFLENVVRGRGVPRERLLAVAEHYTHFGGVSPINDQNRALLAAIREVVDLPVYWGNRNWHPLVEDTVATMRDGGVRRALVFVTSAVHVVLGLPAVPGRPGPGPGGRRRRGSGAGQAAALLQPPRVRGAGRGRGAGRAGGPAGRPAGVHRALDPDVDGGDERAARAPLHRTAAGGVAAGGRGGPRTRGRVRPGLAVPVRAASVPWLEPDVNEHLEALAAAGTRAVVVSPIGFVSDHVEVLWDLDEEAAATAAKLGLDYARAATVGTDPRFVAMVGQLVAERTEGAPQLALGRMGPSHDTCPLGCCPAPRRRP